ncbi:ZIP zinc transporter-domain-containing protein [Apiosordaria backusii]|uniref:ZIP zinc transporter-domain-containing protein n=1 Tax=Apiosordaria backusii TaxID=314023 RepID=A0AA40K7Z0_9PEZI|nr:ZIP zinc transporter-domain-containing protein [Apiosordaria backusii]
MSGLLFLVVTSVVMAVASFLAGALPLSISLTQSQLRFVASLGAGLLVGSCLIVIIPEGIEAIASASDHDHNPSSPTGTSAEKAPPSNQLPAFHIGLSLVLGFALMFLIDRLPRHATDRLHPQTQSRHVSLTNLGPNPLSTDDDDNDLESDTFLGSLTPSPKQTRSLATTIGLVIHAAADGVAMGASATTSNVNVGLIIFFAILVHKAPAAFGLTSTLLKQGLSKRAARVHLMVFSLAAPVGALVTGGTFLYVAMHAMQEENSMMGGGHHDHHHAGSSLSSGGSYSEVGNGGNNRRGQKLELRDTLGTVVGMLLPLLTRFGHHHH